MARRRSNTRPSRRAKRGVRLTVRRRPFANAEELTFPHEPGKGVGYYLDDAGYTVPPGCDPFVALHSRRRVKGLDIEDWDTTPPRPGDIIVVNTLPGKGGGGGGGGGGKSPLSVFTTIASFALAFVLPQFAAFSFLNTAVFSFLPKLTWGAIAGFGLGAIGGLLTQPPKPSVSGLSQTPAGMPPSSPTYSIDDTGNQLLPYGKVPRPVGRFTWSPPMGARPYKDVIGKKLYYRLLLLPGYGPLDISEITLGETPISEFGDAIQLEVREGWESDQPLTLFSDDVYAESLNVLLVKTNGWASRTTLTDVDEISIDIMFPRLANITGSSSRSPLTVIVEVEYSPAGQDNWQPCPWEQDGYGGLETDGEITVTDNSTSEVWRGARFQVTQGQYDVRLRRQTADATDNNKLDKVHWMELRSTRYTDPVTAPGVAKVAMLIEATNELQGSIPPVRLTTHTYYNVYDPGSDTWSYQLSRSPAWASVDALMNVNHNPRPADASRLDLDSFDAWATDCASRGLQCDGVLDYGGTVMGMFNDIAETGWGRFSMNGIKFSVVWDRPISAVTQHFTPHNTIGFTREKLFPTRPHALLCHFINAEKGYQRDVLPVYMAGYDGDSASNYEDREYHLVTDPAQITVTALREMGVSIHRDMKCTLECKMEHLTVMPGQLVSVTRPETGWGLGSGRVKSATQTGVTLTDGVPMVADTPYSISFRYGDQTREVFDLLPKSQDGEYKTVEFGEPDGQGGWQQATIDAGDVPVADNLFQFGETDFVAKTFLVDKIDHTKGDKGTLHLAPEAPEIWAFIQGSQPPYDSGLSDIPDVYRRPDKPVVLGVDSDESVMVALPGGGLSPRIVVSLKPRAGSVFVLSHMEVRIKRADATQWTVLQPLAANATQVVFDGVEQGVEYDLDFMAVSDASLASERALVEAHKVVGKSSPPLDPEGLYVEKLPDGRFRYRPTGDTSRDHAGWLYRWNPGVNLDWGMAAAAHQGVWAVDTFENAAFIDRTFSVLCKSFDSTDPATGNESTGLAYAIVRLGDRITDNYVDGVDYAAQGFPGTITGGAVSGGELRASASSVLYTDPAQPLYNDPDDALYDGYDTLTYGDSLKPLRAGFLNIDYDLDGAALVEYRAGGGEPLYINPNDPLYNDPAEALYSQGGYVAYQGPFEVTPGLGYDIRVTIPGGPARGIIRALAANIEIATETEILNDAAIAAGGTRLSVTRAWSEILKLDFTVQKVGGSTAVRAAYDDLDPTGPLVKTYDTSDVATTGVIDVTVQGIPAPA